MTRRPPAGTTPGAALSLPCGGEGQSPSSASKASGFAALAWRSAVRSGGLWREAWVSGMVGNMVPRATWQARQGEAPRNKDAEEAREQELRDGRGRRAGRGGRRERGSGEWRGGGGHDIQRRGASAPEGGHWRSWAWPAGRRVADVGVPLPLPPQRLLAAPVGIGRRTPNDATLRHAMLHRHAHRTRIPSPLRPRGATPLTKSYNAADQVLQRTRATLR